MCRTRWAARHTAYTHFYQAYTFIITALEIIAYGIDEEMCGEDFQNADWDVKSKNAATALLGSLTSFDFIASFLVLYQFLSHLAGITVKLQGRTVDIIEAYHNVSIANHIYYL